MLDAVRLRIFLIALSSDSQSHDVASPPHEVRGSVSTL